MRPAKAPQADPGPGIGAASGTPSRRAQPVRQTRTNPSRSSGFDGTGAGRDSLEASRGHDQPIDIFPGITHFTDAITSLPKDLVRHFTLLKEVDAKIFAPEETLFQLVEAALKLSPPDLRAAHEATAGSIVPTSAPMSTQNSSTGSTSNGNVPALPSNDENYNAYDPANLGRRQLFRNTALKIQEMLVSLEEKNHVISTANEALTKHLARIDDVWPHLEAEFSDEAKYGSTTHWAYPENRISRASAAERSRRDGASAITAAAQHIANEAAARSDARKQAVAARKGRQNHHHDSDADVDHENSKHHKAEARKANSGKSRKTAEAHSTVGLGISSGAIVNGNPPQKKRRVDNSKDKTTNGAQPMERALSGVFNSSTAKARTASPRGTPTPEPGAAGEPSKKRKALPTLNGHGQTKKSKSNLSTAMSPSVASSSLPPNLADTKGASRSSPAPAATATRPLTSRARQNSVISSNDTRQRPSSAASNKPNGATPSTADVNTAQTTSKIATDIKAAIAEKPVSVKTETAKESLPPPDTTVSSVPVGSRKNSIAKDLMEPKADSVPPPPATVTTVVTTKSGRASKPSTPALGNFPDPVVRSRPLRNAQGGKEKRSHKKGAAAQAALAAQVADEDANSSVQDGDDEAEIDANEPRYCYCNGVSYGEMVACDADDCDREWFHLGCVGLKSAPSSSTKWYCDNCKNRMKNGKKVNGR